MNLKLIKIVLGIGLAITLLCVGIVYYLDNKQDNLKRDILEKIDNVFDGKNVILDYTFYAAEVEKENIPKLREPLISTITNKPLYSEEDEFFIGLKAFYRLKRGAFNIIVAEKQSDYLYRIYKISASDFGYKVKKYDDWGYDQWPSVDNCYGGALKYFLENDPVLKNSHVSGKYSQIADFKYIENEYYELNDGSFEKSGWWSQKGTAITNFYWKVLYNRAGNDYNVCLKKNVRELDFIKYLLIGLAIICILSFIFLYKPKKNESLVKDNTEVSNNNDSIEKQKSNEYEI